MLGSLPQCQSAVAGLVGEKTPYLVSRCSNHSLTVHGPALCVPCVNIG